MKPDLASERTQLAWQRFALGLAIIGALGMRAGLAHHHEVVSFLLAGVLAGVAAVLQVAGPRMRAPTAVRVALGATLVAAVLALVLALG